MPLEDSSFLTRNNIPEPDGLISETSSDPFFVGTDAHGRAHQPDTLPQREALSGSEIEQNYPTILRVGSEKQFPGILGKGAIRDGFWAPTLEHFPFQPDRRRLKATVAQIPNGGTEEHDCEKYEFAHGNDTRMGLPVCGNPS